MSEGRYWEPWQPQLGDRVKIVASPECPVNHLDQAVGVLGTVSNVDSPDDDWDDDEDDDLLTEEDLFEGETMEEMRQSAKNFRGHYYSVQYDVLVPNTRGEHPRMIREELYAAVEMEPL